MTRSEKIPLDNAQMGQQETQLHHISILKNKERYEQEGIKVEEIHARKWTSKKLCCINYE